MLINGNIFLEHICKYPKKISDNKKLSQSNSLSSLSLTAVVLFKSCPSVRIDPFNEICRLDVGADLLMDDTCSGWGLLDHEHFLNVFLNCTCVMESQSTFWSILVQASASVSITHLVLLLSRDNWSHCVLFVSSVFPY